MVFFGMHIRLRSDIRTGLVVSGIGPHQFLMDKAPSAVADGVRQRSDTEGSTMPRSQPQLGELDETPETAPPYGPVEPSGKRTGKQTKTERMTKRKSKLNN